MITINLLPHERRGSAAPVLVRYMIIAGAAVIFAGVLLGTIYANMQVHVKQGDIKKLEKAKTNLDIELKDVYAQRTEEEVLQKKKQVIDKLMLQRLSWAKKLKQLAEITPERVWLEDVHIKLEKMKMEKTETIEGTGTAKGKPRTRKKTYYVTRKRFFIVAVTDDLTNKALWVGRTINNIQSSAAFMEDFNSLRMEMAQEEPWIKEGPASKKGTGSSPLVWRFQLSLEMKSRAEEEEDDTASGSGGNKGGGQRA